MPWVRRSHETYRFYWIMAGIISIMAGVLAGYSWRDDTGSVVTVVEQQLSRSQAEVRMLAKRVKALEAKLGLDENDAEPASTAKAY